jgi:uncharacterized protein YndB with AHSA1/START domain
MRVVRSTVEIDRPVHEVFAYVTDPAHFPEWQDDVVRVEGGTGTSVGSRFTTTRRAGARQFSLTQEVTASEPPTLWAVRGVDGPVRPHAAITIEPLADDTRSRLTAVMDLEGHGIGRVVVPLFVRRRAARQAPVSYRRLKERLERR